jgi:hypothetical protein
MFQALRQPWSLRAGDSAGKSEVGLLASLSRVRSWISVTSSEGPERKKPFKNLLQAAFPS